MATARYPSHFISYNQPGSSKGLSTNVASIGLNVFGNAAFLPSPSGVLRTVRSFFFSTRCLRDFLDADFFFGELPHIFLLVFSIASRVLPETTDLSFFVISVSFAYLSRCLIRSQALFSAFFNFTSANSPFSLLPFILIFIDPFLSCCNNDFSWADLLP